METWQVTLAVVMGLGVAVILLGGFWDRERRLRHQRASTLPPDRDIPGLPETASTPDYLDATTARRMPEGAPSLALDPIRRTALQARITNQAAIGAGWVDEAFITDPDTGWALAEDALVLVCADPAETLRELLPVLEMALTQERALVVVAPGFLPELRETLATNQVQRTMRLLAVGADGERLQQLAERSGATPLSRIDLQAGYAPASALGGVQVWISSRAQTWLIGG